MPKIFLNFLFIELLLLEFCVCNLSYSILSLSFNKIKLLLLLFILGIKLITLFDIFIISFDNTRLE